MFKGAVSACIVYYRYFTRWAMLTGSPARLKGDASIAAFLSSDWPRLPPFSRAHPVRSPRSRSSQHACIHICHRASACSWWGCGRIV